MATNFILQGCFSFFSPVCVIFPPFFFPCLRGPFTILRRIEDVAFVVRFAPLQFPFFFCPVPVYMCVSRLSHVRLSYACTFLYSFFLLPKPPLHLCRDMARIYFICIRRRPLSWCLQFPLLCIFHLMFLFVSTLVFMSFFIYSLFVPLPFSVCFHS